MMHALKSKAALGGAVPRSAVRSSVARKCQPFKGRRSVTVAAADSAEAAPSAPAAAGRKQREKREITVQLDALKQGDVLTGTVVSVEQYGCFVNIGARTDGLVHISQLSDGFVKNTADVVKAGQSVQVRVMSVDVAQNRLALSMKGFGKAKAAAAPEGEGAAAAEEEVDEEEAPGFEDFSEMGITFRVASDDQMTDLDEDVEVDDTPAALRYMDVVTGKVARVETFGVFIDFEALGQKQQGLLHCSEMKAPRAAVAAQAEAAAAGEEADGLTFSDLSGEEYVDVGDVADASKYYKPGDVVSAFVLEVEDDGKLSLTQFDDEDLDMDDPVAALTGENADMEDDYEEEDAFEDIVLDADAKEGLAATVYSSQLAGATQPTAAMLFKGKQAMSPAQFPSRPVKKLHERTLLAQTPASSDEAELIEYWATDVKLPAGALRQLGYKLVKDEAGNWEAVERENDAAKAVDMDARDLLKMVDDRAVAAWADDLLEAEDEAELPARAYRRPVIMAASVEAAPSASAVKDLRNKTGAGMMDCKKALAATGGNIDEAMEVLH